MIQWKDTTERFGTIVVTKHEAKTLLSDMSIIMETDKGGQPLGYCLCVNGQMIKTKLVDLGTAKRQAESILRELCRDQLGVLGQ